MIQWGFDAVSFRPEYALVIAAVESAGFYVTGMPMDSGGDRIVCAGESNAAGLTGNSFWLAERNGDWFLGTWGGVLYQVADVETAAAASVAFLRDNRCTTVSDFDSQLKRQFGLAPADEDSFDAVGE